MAEAIYVRFEKRYWRLSALFKRFDITPSAGYRRHIAYGRPKHYRRWMLKPTGPKAAKPIPIIVDGVPYKSIKEASQALGLPNNRIGRRVKKFGTCLTLEQVTIDDPRGNLPRLKKPTIDGPRRDVPRVKKPTSPSEEWERLSSKKNTGAATQSHTHY